MMTGHAVDVIVIVRQVMFLRNEGTAERTLVGPCRQIGIVLYYGRTASSGPIPSGTIPRLWYVVHVPVGTARESQDKSGCRQCRHAARGSSAGSTESDVEVELESVVKSTQLP